MLIPMFSLEPIELGMAGHEDEVLQRIDEEPRYGPLFELAFPGESNPVNIGNIVLANPSA